MARGGTHDRRPRDPGDTGPAPRRSILFLTSCPLAWGGSEELWAGAATVLRSRGFRVLTGRLESVPGAMRHRALLRLREQGVEIGKFNIPSLLRIVPDFFKRYAPWLAPSGYRVRDGLLTAWLRWLRVDLVVIGQGNSFDGMEYVELPLLARSAGVPNVLICQKAAEVDWPFDDLRQRSIAHFLGARRVYFVSEHNRRLVQQMLGTPLPHAEVVRNPFQVQTRTALPWPGDAEQTVRLACVGRLWPREKGQDLLLNVLAREVWRARPIEVSIYGAGPQEQGLRGLAQLHRLTNVRFRGFTDDITEVWRTHHGLVLPSRAEGLPLALVEAMICGRVAIMTPAGGVGEILTDGQNGFLAEAATEDALHGAMERAWQRRHDWPAIGRHAAQSIWTQVPADPCQVFADQLAALVEAGHTTGG